MKKCLLFIFVLCLGLHQVQAQKRTITGLVREKATGEPLPGVTVHEKSTTNGTVTDTSGEYRISVSPGAVLSFSFIGMNPLEQKVGETARIEVLLESSTEQVDEVIVTALGIRRETRALGYAVQDVKGADLVKVKEPNLINSLNGKIAGVNITNSGGAPGTSSQIVIRGSTSLLGDNQPLFVVDGVPVDNSTQFGDTGTDGMSATATYSGNRAMDLNSDDIESVSVLKGPAAAALYGLKAAAGAVIITTKKGEQGIPRVAVSTKMKLDVVNHLPDQQGLYGQGSDGTYNADTGESWGARIADGTPVYDNLEDYFEPAWSYDINGSISGGSENASYYMSVQRLDQNGIVPTTDYVKNSFRFNGEQKKGWFTVGMNTNYINSQTTKTLTGDGLYGTSGTGYMISIINWPRTDNMAAWEENGEKRRLLPDVALQDDIDNPYWLVRNNPVTEELNRFLGSGYVKMSPFDWMNVTYRAGIDHYNSFTRSITSPGSAMVEPYDEGAVSEIQRQNDLFSSNLTLDVQHKINDFDLGLLVGHNYEQTTYFKNTQTAVGMLSSDFIGINNAADENKTFTNYRSQKRLYSVYGELRAGYKNIAFVSVTGRNDWSSTLSPENRSFFYPSVSGSFVFSEFFPDDLKDAFSFGKVRASWSQVGKDAPVYQTATYLDSPVQSIGGGYKDSWTGGNPDLKPETTTSTELGTDLRFMKGRLGLDFTYYHTKSEDQIIQPRVSNAIGYIFKYVNWGTVVNKGIEITLSGKPVRTKNWRWDTSLNISHNDGTVEGLPDGLDLLYVTDVQIGPAKPASVNNGIFLGLTGQQWQRTEDGQLILSSTTGYPLTSTDATNLVGNREPDLLFGFNNSISFKNWNLSFLIDARMGGAVYNATEWAMVKSGLSKETVHRGETKTFTGVTVSETGEYVEATSTVTLDQNYYQNIYTAESSHFITDVNWLRLRSASLNYSVPEALCRRLGFVEGIDISLSGTNLLLFTNYDGMDPEVSAGGAGVQGAGSVGVDYAGVPATRSVALGLNLKF
jgi:TonB-linked SusC/RagA family outer membrane protein